MKERFESFRKECPVIAILRGITPEEVTDVCETLYNAGIRILEIPLNSPEPIDGIRIAAEKFSGKMMIGAGTVLTVQDVRRVKDAGGQFIVSPNTDVEVIAETVKCGLISIPGFFTASEGFTALKAGADYLKLFPAILGTTYIKDLQAVIKAPILAVGGVNAGNIAEFTRICAGTGIGSAIYKPGKSLADIAADTGKMLDLIR